MVCSVGVLKQKSRCKWPKTWMKSPAKSHGRRLKLGLDVVDQAPVFSVSPMVLPSEMCFFHNLKLMLLPGQVNKQSSNQIKKKDQFNKSAK